MCVYVCVYVCVYTYILPTKITLLFSRMGFCSEKKMHSRWLIHFQGSYPWPSCCPLKFNIFKTSPSTIYPHNVSDDLNEQTFSHSPMYEIQNDCFSLYPRNHNGAKYISDPLIKSRFSIRTACSLNQSFNPSSPFSDLHKSCWTNLPA